MEEYEDPDNLIETDPVRCVLVFTRNVLLYMMQRLDAVGINHELRLLILSVYVLIVLIGDQR